MDDILPFGIEEMSDIWLVLVSIPLKNSSSLVEYVSIILLNYLLRFLNLNKQLNKELFYILLNLTIRFYIK